MNETDAHQIIFSSSKLATTAGIRVLIFSSMNFIHRYFCMDNYAYNCFVVCISFSCTVLLLWLNASLRFHIQFTEDIYLRVNQTTRQNTTQNNKAFICKPSRQETE